MHVLLAICFLIQAFFAAHAVMTGREKWWVAVILCIPIAGVLVYFFVELLPEMSQDQALSESALNPLTTKEAKAALSRLKEAVKESDTVHNRQELARGYMRAGDFKGAIEEYEKCRSRGYGKDGGVLLELAYAHFFDKDLDASLGMLELGEKHAPDHEPAKRELLTARVLEKQGDAAAAISRLESLVSSSPTNEARCRLALLLRKAGRTKDADRLFKEILSNAETLGPADLVAERKWVGLAHKNLDR